MRKVSAAQRAKNVPLGHFLNALSNLRWQNKKQSNGLIYSRYAGSDPSECLANEKCSSRTLGRVAELNRS